MKNRNLNIDDLFSKARAEELVLSRNDIDNLLSNYSKPPAYGFFEKLFKGDKKMISLIGATAAAISVIFLSAVNFGDNQTDNSINAELNRNINIQSHSNSHSDILSNNRNPAEKETKLSEAVNDQVTIAKAEDIPETQTISNGNDNSGINSDIKGIKSLKLTPEEIKALGFEVDPTGSFISVLLSKNNPKLRKIYVDWGVGYNDKDAIIENPEDYVIPRMITDNRGMRRIEIISEEGTDISIDQMMSTMMGSENMNSIIDDLMNSFSDKDILDGNKFDSEKFIKMLSLHFEQNSTYFNNLKIDSDSSKKVVEMLQNLSSDDIQKMVEDLSGLKNKMSNFKIQINNLTGDSSLKNKSIIENKQVMIILDQNSNDTTKVENRDINVLVDKREKNEDGSLKDDRNFEITFNNKDVKPLKINLPSIDINKLLPVEISLPNARDKQGNILKDFSFILWLNLDEETYELMPERIRNEVKPEFDALTKTEGAVCGFSPNEDGENYLDIWRTCAGAIEELTASPNPTDGLVNLSFLLKENRNVSISVNDVFGKKVQDVVVNRRMNKGEILESFHLKAPEAGMYLIVVQTNAGEQAVHRIILNK
ncbi:MAG: T9SS type A sorting domain-containing protein [Candidatus Kapabacteria bacterium]|nr:T9SS type A sorting domain-containing protein [Ignavibacteriota bacterium]MCW5885090.1 T9SS type A sorting domain-containing protein [Candidatus Kapabacteria bacterium]